MKFFSICIAMLIVTFAPRSSTASQPNVLLIITDEHNFRTLGCYREQLTKPQAEMWGKDAVVETPHIDSLAHRGILCTRGYATSPVCSPCRAAMITGRYPHAVGVPTNDLPLSADFPTLAQRLNAKDYRTAFFGKWHLGGTGKPEWEPKVDGGFKFKEFMFNRGHWKKFEIIDGKPRVAARKKGKASYDVAGADETSFATDFLTDRAIEFVNGGDKPFFAVISYPDPHGPNTVRKPYCEEFTDMSFVPPRTYDLGAPTPGWLGGTKNHPVFRGQTMAQYFGMVKCIDDNIGRLLKQLELGGKLDNTLIIFTSDHGDLCYEHDRLNKGNPYEGSARVPMIMFFPGQLPAGVVYKEPVGTVDLTPTIAGLVGVESLQSDQGQNLAVALSGESAEKEGEQVIFLRNAGKGAGWLAAIDERYKLVVSVNDKPWLFDNQLDPDELLNFYGRPGTTGVAERLAEALQKYGQQMDDPHIENSAIAGSIAEILGNQ